MDLPGQQPDRTGPATGGLRYAERSGSLISGDLSRSMRAIADEKAQPVNATPDGSMITLPLLVSRYAVLPPAPHPGV